jgi:hypothetical protein
MREVATKIEKPIEADSTSPDFVWVGPGIVEWSRSWANSKRNSKIFGEMPNRGKRLVKFDFRNEDQSDIIFGLPTNGISENGFFYSYLGYNYYYDFALVKLFFWTDLKHPYRNIGAEEGKPWSDFEVISEKDGYQIKASTCVDHPKEDDLKKGITTVLFRMREVATLAEIPFELKVNQFFPHFVWVSPGVVEWSREWAVEGSQSENS